MDLPLMTESQWRNLNLIPAPGWRAIYLTETLPFWEEVPLAGWMVRERVELMPGTNEILSEPPPGDRPREIVPVIWHDDDGFIRPTQCNGMCWGISGPGQPAITLDDLKDVLKEEQIAELDRAMADRPPRCPACHSQVPGFRRHLLALESAEFLSACTEPWHYGATP